MAKTLAKREEPPQQAVWRDDRFTRLLEAFDKMVYAFVGASFLIAAIVSLCYGIAKFGYTLWTISGSSAASIFDQPDASAALITFVSDLLLTLIILEVMGTIVHYLKTRATTLKAVPVHWHHLRDEGRVGGRRATVSGEFPDIGVAAIPRLDDRAWRQRGSDYRVGPLLAADWAFSG